MGAWGGNFRRIAAKKNPDQLIMFIMNKDVTAKKWNMDIAFRHMTKLVQAFLTSSFYSDVMIQDETKLHQHVNVILVWSLAVLQRSSWCQDDLQTSHKRPTLPYCWTCRYVIIPASTVFLFLSYITFYLIASSFFLILLVLYLLLCLTWHFFRVMQLYAFRIRHDL
jgi:hypothetical protein